MTLIRKTLAIAIIIVAAFAIFFQICELILFRSTGAFAHPDIVSSGIWGGAFLVLFGGLLIADRLNDGIAVLSLAVYGALIGVTIVSLYSWSIARYQQGVSNCQGITIDNTNLCGRVALDSLMLVCGLLILGLNVLIAFMSFTIAKH